MGIAGSRSRPCKSVESGLMASKVRKLMSSGSQDAKAVLSTAVNWESLRAAYWANYGRFDLADVCFAKAQNYEVELTLHCQRINKGT